MPSPTGPTTDTQTLPATSSPATMAASPLMCDAWGPMTERSERSPRRGRRVRGSDLPETRPAGLSSLAPMGATLPVAPDRPVNRSEPLRR